MHLILRFWPHPRACLCRFCDGLFQMPAYPTRRVWQLRYFPRGCDPPVRHYRWGNHPHPRPVHPPTTRPTQTCDAAMPQKSFILPRNGIEPLSQKRLVHQDSGLLNVCSFRFDRNEWRRQKRQRKTKRKQQQPQPQHRRCRRWWNGGRLEEGGG